jgi:hypothetical protein
MAAAEDVGFHCWDAGVVGVPANATHAEKRELVTANVVVIFAVLVTRPRRDQFVTRRRGGQAAIFASKALQNYGFVPGG